MKRRRKSVEIREVLAIFDQRLEFLKYKAQRIKADRKELERLGIFEEKVADVKSDRIRTMFLRQEVSRLRYLQNGKPQTLEQAQVQRAREIMRACQCGKCPTAEEQRENHDFIMSLPPNPDSRLAKLFNKGAETA